MKTTIKTAVIATFVAMTATTTIANETSYVEYLSEINAQITDFNPATFTKHKGDPEFQKLEEELVEIVAQMKGFWFVSTGAREAIKAPVAATSDIENPTDYLAQLDQSANELNTKVFKGFRDDEEYLKLESRMIELMKEMAAHKK